MTSRRTKRYLVAGGVLVFISAPIVETVLTLTELPALPVIALSAVVIVALVLVWVRRAGPADDGGSAWGAIPSSQYTGRFAEAGGITRGEQERALGRSRDDE